jgi:DnaK suppressor protein
MKHLTDDFIEKTRIKLENQKSEIFEKKNDLMKQDPFSDPERLNDNAASDMEATEESSHDRVQALIDELDRQLVIIDLALQAIGQKMYGICVDCKKPIEIERLNALPTATTCLTCESKRQSMIS